MCCFFNLDSITSCELRISFRKCESSVCRSWFALSLNLDFVTSFALKLSWGGEERERAHNTDSFYWVDTELRSRVSGRGKRVMDPPKNLITNPTFIWGSDHGWQPMCCSLSICDQPPLCGPPPSGHQFYCVAHNRTQAWQGIAQDLTGRIKVMMLTLLLFHRSSIAGCGVAGSDIECLILHMLVCCTLTNSVLASSHIATCVSISGMPSVCVWINMQIECSNLLSTGRVGVHSGSLCFYCRPIRLF